MDPTDTVRGPQGLRSGTQEQIVPGDALRTLSARLQLLSQGERRVIFRLTDLSRGLPAPKNLLRSLLGDGAKSYSTVRVQRLFEPLIRNGQIRELIERAEASDHGYGTSTQRLEGLTRYFVLDVAFASLDPLIAALTKYGAAAEEAVLLPSGIGDVDPRIDHKFLDDGPVGVGARYAWSFPSGRGAGVRFVDVELGWNTTRRAFKNLAVTLIQGDNISAEAWHGTAVLGIVAKPDTGEEFAGVAQDATSVRVLSIQHGHQQNLPRSILRASQELRFGDVLLIEVTRTKDRCDEPVEIGAATFDAIRLASALGIVVIEPAGNRGCELAELKSGLEGSGALIVGGAKAEGGHPCLNNYGRRVDCYAWGEAIGTIYFGHDWLLQFLTSHGQATAVTTTDEAQRGAGGLQLFALTGDELTTKLSLPPLPLGDTGTFDGTSGAAAIIAGVVMVIQGLAQAHLRFRYSPWQMALLLRDPANGTPSADGGAKPIGLMPDLRKIIDMTMGIPALVYMRDHVGDDGDESSERRWTSPDIVVSDQKVMEPQERYGEGSGTEDRVQGLDVAASSDFYVYLRARNRGGMDANWVRAALFRSPVATVMLPDLWERVGDTLWPHLPQGDQLAVSEGILVRGGGGGEDSGTAWIACLLGGDEPLPKPGEDWERLGAFLALRQVACRNLHVAKPAERIKELKYFSLPFLMPGLPGPSRETSLETLSRLPRQARAWLEAPVEIADLAGIAADPPFDRLSTLKKLLETNIFLPVNPAGHHYFRAVKPETEESRRKPAWLRVIVELPERFDRIYQIAVRQMLEGKEIGRVTWRLLS